MDSVFIEFSLGFSYKKSSAGFLLAFILIDW